MIKSDTQIFLEKEYKNRKPKGHWFDRETMEFFDSKIHTGTFTCGDYILFTESQQPSHGSRIYNTRIMNKYGQIRSIYTEKTLKLAKAHLTKEILDENK